MVKPSPRPVKSRPHAARSTAATDLENSSHDGSTPMRWYFHLVLYLLLLIPIALLCFRPITDSDYWHHLAFARTALTQPEFPITDQLGSTTAGRPWVSSGWLPSILLTQINPPQLLVALVVLVALVALLKRTLTTSPVALILALLTLLAAYPRFLPRPDVFSILFIVLLINLFSHYAFRPLQRTRGGFARAGALPLLMLIWVNCHMLFIIGLGIAGIFTAWALWETRHGRRSDGLLLLGAWLAALAVTLINPYGWRVYWFIWENAQLAHTRQRINELKPLLGLLTEPGGTFSLSALTAWLATCTFLIISQWKQRRLASWQILIISALLVLMLIQRRQIGLATFGISTIIMSNPPLPAWLGRASGWCLVAAIYLGVTALIASGAVPTVPPANTPFLARTQADTEWQPAEAIPFLRQNPPPARLFHDLYSGSYLAYHLAPTTRVFIDGRLEVYNNGTYDDFFAPMEGRLSPQALFSKYGVHSALLDWRGADQNPRSIAAQLSDDPAWALCWFSDHYALFVRRDQADPTALAYIDAHGYRYLNPLRPQTYMDALANPPNAATARIEARRAHDANPTSHLAAMAMQVSGQSAAQ